jgi:HK97 family phage major capsid protein
MLQNETLLQKADLALSDLQTGNGLLQPEQAQKFLRLLIQEAVIMKMATVQGLKSQKKFINKIKFGSRILRAGTPGRPLSLADRSVPTFTSNELDTKLFKAEVRLNNEELEDSIERGELRQTIMTMMAEKIASDMDDMIINGDTASTDPFLASFDGLLKQVASNTYDHGANTANRALWKALLKTMPNQYLRNKKNLAFLTSVNADIDYRDSLADRATANVGDRFVEQDAPAMYSGVPVVPVPLFPENIGTATQCTDAILIDPKNINVGIWRDILMETDKLVSEGVVIIVATMRFDMKLAEETAAVKATNVHTHV